MTILGLALLLLGAACMFIALGATSFDNDCPQSLGIAAGGLVASILGMLLLGGIIG